MRLRPSLVAIVPCLVVAACGGSSRSSTQATGPVAASSSETPATSNPGVIGETATFSVSGEGPAITTTSGASAPPEVAQGKKQKHRGAPGGASQGAHVETDLTIKANGDASPPVVSVPSGVGVELHVTNHGSATATVVLSVPSHVSVKVAPGATQTLETPGLKDGTYRILVNGTPRGQLMIGAQGGP